MTDFMTKNQLALMCCVSVVGCAPKLRARHCTTEGHMNYPTLRNILLFVFAMLFAAHESLVAQQPLLTGVQDSSFSTPRYEGNDGVKDSSALVVLREYLKATNVENSKGMKSVGNIVIGSGAAEQQGIATMTVEGAKRFRFDIEASTGKVSTRIDGMSGSLQREGMDASRIPMETAASGALISPWNLSELMNEPLVSFQSQGTAIIDNESMLKITLHRPICASSNCPESLQRVRLTTDLYFDNQSRLLVKSVEMIRFSEASQAKALRVISYSDYRQAGQALVPYKYSETLNGQLIWALGVSDVSFHDVHESSYFHF